MFVDFRCKKIFFFYKKLYVLYFILYFPTRLKMIDEFRLLLGVSGLFVLDIINYWIQIENLQFRGVFSLLSRSRRNSVRTELPLSVLSIHCFGFIFLGVFRGCDSPVLPFCLRLLFSASPSLWALFSFHGVMIRS